MRILITNNHLSRLGGTETWLLTMTSELSRQHEVHVFTHERGYVSDLLKPLVTDRPPRCDLALINHRTCLHVSANVKVFTSHGVVPHLEVPRDGADAYVAVSEEVARTHNLERIIRNPIDTVLFRPRTAIAESPRRALAIVSEQALHVVRQACHSLGIDVITPTRCTYDMPDLINEVDMVFSIGRGVLEAMSCGRPVVVYDEREYATGGDGYFNDPRTRQCNYSGRYFNTCYDAHSLIAEIRKYDRSDGARNRAYVLEHHDVRKISEQYLAIHAEVMDSRSGRSRPDTTRPRPSTRSMDTTGATSHSMRLPLASIVLVDLENSQFRDRAIASALNQTYSNVEVVLVHNRGDHRIDRSASRHRHRAISVVSERGGQAASFNAGFRASSGAVVLFLESNDFLTPRTMETAVKSLLDQRVALVHWPLREVNYLGAALEDVRPKGVPDGDLRESVIRSGPLEHEEIPGAAVAWSRDYLERVLPIPETNCQDDAIDFLFQLSPLFGHIRKVWEPQGFRTVLGQIDTQADLTFADKISKRLMAHRRHSVILGQFCESLGLPVDSDGWTRDSWWNQLRLANDEILALVLPGEFLVLVDEGQFEPGFAPGRRVVPFLERDGVYWGLPPDDDTAICELERLRERGADFVAFGWPAFWWLDHYAGLSAHLDVRYPCVFKNARLTVFKLRP